MILSDLRKAAVKKHLRIRFPLSNGMECVVNEHGIAQVPALRGVPSFNLEEELGGAQDFLIDPPHTTAKAKPETRKYTRDQMSALLAAGPGREAAPDEHEE